MQDNNQGKIEINDEVIAQWLGEETYQRKAITLKLTNEIKNKDSEIKRLNSVILTMQAAQKGKK